jgi:PilZ domain
MGEPAANISGEDKRRHPRHRVMRRGVLIHAPTGRSFSCIIVDISVGGARLHLVGGDLPRKDLTLVDVRNGAAHDVRVMWGAVGVLGVAFEKSRPL